MYIWWGPDLACLYNDAYRASIGPERHPGSLGQPARVVWDEIWDIIGPQIEQVMSGGGATWHVDHLVPITRHGRKEDVYWTYSYSPIDDDQAPNGIGGVLVVCTETTAQVRAADDLAAALARERPARTDADHANAPTVALVDLGRSLDRGARTIPSALTIRGASPGTLTFARVRLVPSRRTAGRTGTGR